MNTKYFVLICSLLIAQATIVKPDLITENLKEDVQKFYKDYPTMEKISLL